MVKARDSVAVLKAKSKAESNEAPLIKPRNHSTDDQPRENMLNSVHVSEVNPTAQAPTQVQGTRKQRYAL